MAHSEAASEHGGQYAGHLVRAEGVGDENSVAGHEGQRLEGGHGEQRAHARQFRHDQLRDDEAGECVLHGDRERQADRLEDNGSDDDAVEEASHQTGVRPCGDVGDAVGRCSRLGLC